MAEKLKNVYTKDYIQTLSNKIKNNFQNFDDKGFKLNIFNNNWQNLELKDRMRHIALCLNTFLPFCYKEQLDILKEVSKSFTGFEAMFFQDFVEVFGLDDFENSMKALEIFTIDSSSEFAIRQFILKYEDETMAQLKFWAKSENEHIRRLASEGCRPRLPWAIALPKFKNNPTKVFQILELLKNDPSKYVQKSVANNLNDISKDNPELVLNFVKNNLGKSKNLDWICKHASRTLLKKGDKECLELFGFLSSDHIQLVDFNIDNTIVLGEDLNFSFTLQSQENLGNIRVEYEIEYMKAKGKTSKKIFMVFQGEVKQKNKSFFKKQSFKNMTTRKHYEGIHNISIVINGTNKKSKSFLLKRLK